jgi:hypothetical protein
VSEILDLDPPGEEDEPFFPGLGSFISVNIEDPNDPESPLTALLWTTAAAAGDADPIVLAWTQTGQEDRMFFWLVKAAAEKFGIELQDDSGRMPDVV